ncbi:MAG: bifunctional folylpolyglutamate synthase/dihydrofolate synthase [Actinomycetota bacterium]
MTPLPVLLDWLASHTDHETGSLGVSAGRIDGLDLDSMRSLMHALGDPQQAQPVIHITGTNGKGSVASMVTALLLAHGLTVGTASSPHLRSLNERVQRNAEPITDSELAEALDGVRSIEPLLDHTPTWFEIMVAASLRYFAEAPVDVAVVEVGLLGRFDATNVVDGVVSVVTSIGGDHTDFAEGWEAAVASEKAGILRPDGTAVLGEMNPDLWPLFSAEGPARLWCAGRDFDVADDRVAVGAHVVDIDGVYSLYPDVTVPLAGAHQTANAAVAVAATEAFFDRPLDPEAVTEAFASVRIEGRCEVVAHHPLVVLDGAHNPDAAAALARTFNDEFAVIGSRYLLLGLLAGRDPDRFVDSAAAIRPDLVVCVPVGEGARRGDPAPLAAAWRRRGVAAESVGSIAAGLDRVRAAALEEDLIVVAGSFRLLDEARSFLAEGD